MEWFFRVCVLWRLLYLRIFGMARDFTQLDAAYQNYKDKATVADDDKADLAAKSKARAEAEDAETAATSKAERSEQDRVDAKDQLTALMA